MNVTETVIEQGRVLVRATEALGTIESTDWFERKIAGLLQASYKQRLRALVEALPGWVTEEILSASEHIWDDRAAAWMNQS